jgi:hypothetical protein
MPYTIEDFRRDYVKEHLKDLTPEEILAALLRKEGTQMSYTMEDFRRDYVKEHLKDLTPEELLAGLPPEKRAALLERLKREELSQPRSEPSEGSKIDPDSSPGG